LGADLLRRIRRAASEAGVGQDHRGLGALRAVMSATAYGSGMPQQRDGLYQEKAGAENQALSPGLEFGLRPGGPMQEG
jgi:hypothetical protein